MDAPVIPYAVEPKLESMVLSEASFSGALGTRIRAAIDGWLLPMPDANPALIEMFRDRDRTPSRDLVPWAGEFVGKYLTSAQLISRLIRSDSLRDRIAQVVDSLLSLQDSDGYLGPFDKATRLNEKWDIWGHYHVMLGLLLYYEDTGDRRVLPTCERIIDLLHRHFIVNDQRMLTKDDPDGEKNHAIAHALTKFYRVTGNSHAHALLDWIEEQSDIPPAGQYMRSALAGTPVWKFPAHRWESVHSYQFITERALLAGDARYHQATEHIWWSILEGDRHNTGGFTSDEGCQGNPYHLGAIETCCTVAWVAFSIDYLRLTGDSRVADEIELSTFNGITGGQHPSGRWWTYNTPMNGVKKASAHDIVFQARAGSPELNCCSVNGPRGLGMISQWGFMRASDGVAINYYGPCFVTSRMPSGNTLTIQQNSQYPIEPDISINIDITEEEKFPILLRIPAWSRKTHVSVNGVPERSVSAGTYHTILRRWHTGDTISITLDFSIHIWAGDHECAGTVSIYRGPILLAYDPRYDRYDPSRIPQIEISDTMSPIAWNDTFAPWLLTQVRADNGDSVTLCDFAHAGSTGTSYRSWLPTEKQESRTFSRQRALWV